MGKPEGKRPLGRPRYRCEYNVKMGLRQVGCEPENWADLAEDVYQWRAYVRAAMKLKSQLVSVPLASFSPTSSFIDHSYLF